MAVVHATVRYCLGYLEMLAHNEADLLDISAKVAKTSKWSAALWASVPNQPKHESS